MRDKNIAIFEETLNICQRGNYKVGGETVSLKLSHDDMVQAIALSPDMSQRIMDNAMNIGTDRAFVMGRTGVYMENRDSFEVAKDIIPSYDRDREDSKSILVLNFANPVHPGGGVTRGARAQEEDLCRKSTLYMSLLSDEARRMYDYNQEVRDYLATDYMVLSPNVEIFRDSHGALSEETYVVGVLTAAAHFDYKYLVLGAWGCGAFGVLDRTTNQYNFKAFQKYFANFYAEEENAEQERGDVVKRDEEKK